MTNTLTLEVSDVSAQHQYQAQLPGDEDLTVQELLQELSRRMELPSSDANGRPTSYSLLHDGEGRVVNPSERVHEAFKTGDRVVLTPHIEAGRA